MSSPKHDPVTALSESAATGRTAEIFADIRDVMRIPLLTSVWRSLAGVEGALEITWSKVRPIMASGQPDAALEELKLRANFPKPNSTATEWPSRLNIEKDDVRPIFAVIDSYNRSNGLNLIALTALLSTDGHQSVDLDTPTQSPVWNEFPKLLEKNEISGSTWALLERIKHLGSVDDRSAIATLWRHLAHWPRLLEMIISGYEPLQDDGSLQKSIDDVLGRTAALCSAIKVTDRDISDFPEDALTLIDSYVHDPGSVCRMVTLGHGTREWLDSGVS